ncbi:hypothetical protein SMICM17S_11396 [Streptomyces microflavus]
MAGGGHRGRQLLAHTSGFRSWDSALQGADPGGEAPDALERGPGVPTPGSAYLYSDLNLISLQLILERITRSRLDVPAPGRGPCSLGMPPPLQPAGLLESEVAGRRGRRLPWSGLERRPGPGRGARRERLQLRRGGGPRRGVLLRLGPGGGPSPAPSSTGASTAAPHPLRGLRRPPLHGLQHRVPGRSGAEHGLALQLYQHWYMGAMATPRTAGQHPDSPGPAWCSTRRPTPSSSCWATPSIPYGAGPGSARWRPPTSWPGPSPVRPERGRTAWFSGMASASSATLALPALRLKSDRSPLIALWWDTEPGSDRLCWRHPRQESRCVLQHPRGRRLGPPPPRPATSPGGLGLRLCRGGCGSRCGGGLLAWRGRNVQLRWRYTTDQLYVGRGAYVDSLRVRDGGGHGLRLRQAPGRGTDRGDGLGPVGRGWSEAGGAARGGPAPPGRCLHNGVAPGAGRRHHRFIRGPLDGTGRTRAARPARSPWPIPGGTHHEQRSAHRPLRPALSR